MTQTRRYIAHQCARAIIDGYLYGGIPPGAAFVVVINETEQAQGLLEVDASVKCGAALTPEGGELIVEFARRLRNAVEQITSDIANEHGVALVQRKDIELALDDLDDDPPLVPPIDPGTMS